MKKKRSITRIVLAVILVSILGGIGFWIGFRRQHRAKQSRNLGEILTEVDYALSLGYTLRAGDLLSVAADQAYGERNHLRILKRVYQIGKLTGDFESLEIYAGSALIKLSGSLAIKQAYAYAALRSARYSEALNAFEGTPKNVPLQYLWAEANVVNDQTIPDIDRLQQNLRQLISLLDEDRASVLERSAKTLGDDRILLDSALRWMAEEEPAQAFQLIDAGVAATFPEPSAYIAYESGNLDQAARFIELLQPGEEKPELILLYADILRFLNRPAEAREQYQRLIVKLPEYSWMPYLNLAWLLEQEGEADAGRTVREDAFTLFPEEEQVVLSLAESLWISGDKGSAQRLIDDFLDDDPTNLQAFLLRQKIVRGESPKLLGAALWRFFNQYPDNKDLCDRLVIFLLNRSDLQSAIIALNQFDNASNPVQVAYLRGITAGLVQKYDASIQSFQESIAYRNGWRNRYNLSLVLQANRQYPEAIRTLLQAENLLSNRSADEFMTEQSRVRSRLAEVYLAYGDESAARRESEYALELDSTNLRARIVRKKLDEDAKK